jgi:adenylosuccinate lyase
MSAIWEPENRFRIWLDIEVYACEALAAAGIIPESAARAVREKGAFEVARIDEIERETRHDVIAFLTNLAEHVGPEARFVHQGMTSSDVLDTCLAVQLRQAADILLRDLDELLAVLRRRAFEHKNTMTIGRSHGIHAEPTTFGLKLASFYAEFQRDRRRLEEAKAEISTCAISGAVGTFANVDPGVEEYVAAKLGLEPEPVSTQIIPRDRHAVFFATLGIIASSLERLAVEIRHLQRSEVREAEEYFAPGQKGSSAMPHKRNRCSRKTSRASPASSAARSFPPWRTSRSGTSATSRIRRSSGSTRRTPPSRSTSRWRAQRGSWTSSSSIPRRCAATSTSSAASSIRSACCWR